MKIAFKSIIATIILSGVAMTSSFADGNAKAAMLSRALPVFAPIMETPAPETGIAKSETTKYTASQLASIVGLNAVTEPAKLSISILPTFITAEEIPAPANEQKLDTDYTPAQRASIVGM